MDLFLLFLSFPYRLGCQFKNWLYEGNILKPKKSPLPVISVGNIVFGGSEKTPLVIEIIRFLLKRGYKPALITRGYKGAWEKQGGVLSDGRKIFGSWEDSGDEPFMVAQNIPHSGIFVGKNRHISCHKASELGFDVCVLDDGFQHRSLLRDLDIVLHDPSENVPRREPLSSLKRAHVLLLRRGKGAWKKKFIMNKTIFEYSVVGKGFYRLGIKAQPIEAEKLKDEKVIAFCGIARPERFLSLLHREEIFPEEFLTFPDHHPYPLSSFKKITKAYDRAKAQAVITTEKDAVKISTRLDQSKIDGFYLKIGLEIEEPFYTTLLSYLQREGT